MRTVCNTLVLTVPKAIVHCQVPFFCLNLAAVSVSVFPTICNRAPCTGGSPEASLALTGMPHPSSACLTLILGCASACACLTVLKSISLPLNQPAQTCTCD